MLASRITQHTKLSISAPRSIHQVHSTTHMTWKVTPVDVRTPEQPIKDDVCKWNADMSVSTGEDDARVLYGVV